MSTRIYVVSTKSGKVHLVEAATGPQAIRHVTKGLISAKVASAKDTADLMASGVKLEKVTDDATPAE